MHYCCYAYKDTRINKRSLFAIIVWICALNLNNYCISSTFGYRVFIALYNNKVFIDIVSLNHIISEFIVEISKNWNTSW